MNTAEITLAAPIKRGDAEITTLSLIRPGVAALRGVSLSALVNMDVDAVAKLLPRITSPALTSAEVEKLDVADLVGLADQIMGFLLSSPPSPRA